MALWHNDNILSSIVLFRAVFVIFQSSCKNGKHAKGTLILTEQVRNRRPIVYAFLRSKKLESAKLEATEILNQALRHEARIIGKFR